jgi:hypothetical protein
MASQLLCEPGGRDRAVDNHQHKDGQIGMALESLTRQVSASWQDKLTELRTRIDQQLASLEAALDETRTPR